MFERFRPFNLAVGVRYFFCRLLCLGCGPRLVLLRHADYDGGPGDPSLNADGLARRDQLAHVLSEIGVSHIIVSQWARTAQTAQTLATATGLTPEQITHNNYAAIVAAARSHPSTVLIVGHSDTVPELIRRFTGTPGPVIASTDFDNMFISERTRLIHLRYGA